MELKEGVGSKRKKAVVVERKRQKMNHTLSLVGGDSVGHTTLAALINPVRCVSRSTQPVLTVIIV